MKLKQNNIRALGFTRVELLAVIGCVGLLAMTFLSAQTVDLSAQNQTVCQNNLKQLGLAVRTWEGDHGDRYPMSVSTNQGGSKEWLAGDHMYRHFQVMSNELGNPKILICPSDDRKPATGFEVLKNENLSYFVGLDADETKPTMMLSGDRNLVTNGVPAVAGLVTVTSKDTVNWSETMHHDAGNFGLADGSVQQASSRGLQRSFQFTGTKITRLAVP